MLKKKVIKISEVKSPIKCGDCMHFKKLAKFEKVCSQLGTKHYANAPSCYFPDAYKLATQSPDMLYRLGLWFKDLTAQEARILGVLLNSTTSLEKRYKLKFGQPVFFCLGQDYLSNFFRGFVLGASPMGDDQVFITSDLNKTQRKQPMIASMMRESVYTVPEFKKHKEKLIKLKRLNDPSPLFAPTPTVTVDVGYVPPSMETASPDWFDKIAKKKLKKKKTSRIKEIGGTLTFEVRNR
jgi:hypothetical protein